MTLPSAGSERPSVSIIVPARNEEDCLGACLQSLVAQGGLSFEVIVVDDGSTDRTRQIAGSFAGVKIVDAGPLPPGWTGKNNAMAAGVRAATGGWLLFTDADTVHQPGSLARALAEAKQHGAALLSYSPEQEVCGIWEQAVMPVIFAELARRFRPSQVSDPRSPVAAANGQYILVSRAAYDAVGGHAAIAGNLLEDVGLARLMKSSGRRIFFRYGGDAVCTRMYRSFAQLREGWTKNLALLFPSPNALATLRLLEFLAILASLEIAVLALLTHRAALAAFNVMLFLLLCAAFVARIRKAHFANGATALSVFGLPLFSFLLLRSAAFHRRGKVEWKQRTYDPRANSKARGIANASPGVNIEEHAEAGAPGKTG